MISEYTNFYVTYLQSYLVKLVQIELKYLTPVDQ